MADVLQVWRGSGRHEITLNRPERRSMTVYLAQAVGVRRARQLSYTGELIDAAEALRLGLANEVLPHAGLLPRAREVATAVAAVDASFLTELRAAYQRRGNVGTDDALDAERAASSRREIAADGVAARRDAVMVTIDNPPVNALTRPLFAELRAITEELTASPPGAMVLAGRPKVFALGGEISETYRVRFAGRTNIGDAELDDAVRTVTEPAYIRELGGKYLATFDALAAVPCMVIAAITGIAFGGGLELALACDYRIAAERAKLGAPEVTLGGGSIGGGVFRMPRLIGPSMAKKMYLGGMPVSAREALRIGLVDEVADGDGTVARALELARSFTAYAGPAQAGLKRLIDAGYGLSGAAAGELELEAWCASYATGDARARLREFFARGPDVG